MDLSNMRVAIIGINRALVNHLRKGRGLYESKIGNLDFHSFDF